jgi:hypothetical protein
VAFTSIVFLLQSRMIYLPNMPSRVVTATPGQVGLAYEPVTFTAEDGVHLGFAVITATT